MKSGTSCYDFLATKLQLDVVLVRNEERVVDIYSLAAELSLLEGVRFSGAVDRSVTSQVTVFVRVTGVLGSLKRLEKFLSLLGLQPGIPDGEFVATSEGSLLIAVLKAVTFKDPQPSGQPGNNPTGDSNKQQPGTAELRYLRNGIKSLLRVILRVPNIHEVRAAIIQALPDYKHPEGYGPPEDIFNFVCTLSELDLLMDAITNALEAMQITVSEKALGLERAAKLLWVMEGERRLATLRSWRAEYSVVAIELKVPEAEIDGVVQALAQVVTSLAIGLYAPARSERDERLFIIARVICVTELVRFDALLDVLEATLDTRRIKPVERSLDGDIEAAALMLFVADVLLAEQGTTMHPSSKSSLIAVKEFAKQKLS